MQQIRRRKIEVSLKKNIDTNKFLLKVRPFKKMDDSDMVLRPIFPISREK